MQKFNNRILFTLLLSIGVASCTTESIVLPHKSDMTSSGDSTLKPSSVTYSERHVAHGLGPVWHEGTLNRWMAPSNTLDGYEWSIAEGITTYEVDIVAGADGPLVAHDRTEDRYGLPFGVTFAEITDAEYTALEYRGVSNEATPPAKPPSRDWLLAEMKSRPEARWILDLKMADKATYALWFLDQLSPEDQSRVWVMLKDEKQMDAVLARHPNYRGNVLMLGYSQWRGEITDVEAVRIAMRADVAAVMLWVSERKSSQDLIEANAEHRRWTPRLAELIRAAGADVILHTVIGDSSESVELARQHLADGSWVLTNSITPSALFDSENPVLVPGLEGS